MPAPTRLLLLADRAVDDVDRLPAVVRWLVAQRADHVRVLAPLRTSGVDWLTGDVAEAEAEAQRRMVAVRDALAATGVEVSGAVADDDPVGAVAAAVAEQPVDAVVLLRPEHDDLTWREHDLIARLRAEVPVPVLEVTLRADGTVVDDAPVDGRAAVLPVDPDAPGGSVDDRRSPEAVEPNEPA